MSALAEKSVAELEIDDGEFRVLKQRLIAEKQALQADLSAIKERCLVRLPLAEYQKLQRQRSRLVQQLMAKERELSELNAKRAELETVKQFRKESSITVSKMRELVGIRDHWHGFSMDEKNAPMARRLAWKFSQQLREFLKPYFSDGLLPGAEG